MVALHQAAFLALRRAGDLGMDAKFAYMQGGRLRPCGRQGESEAEH